MGGSTRRTGWNAHQSAPLGLAEVVTESLGHGAPAATQLRSEVTSSPVSLRPGGILRSPVCSIARIRTLSSGLPGLIAAPRLPPATSESRPASERPLDLR